MSMRQYDWEMRESQSNWHSNFCCSCMNIVDLLFDTFNIFESWLWWFGEVRKTVKLKPTSAAWGFFGWFADCCDVFFSFFLSLIHSKWYQHLIPRSIVVIWCRTFIVATAKWLLTAELEAAKKFFLCATHERANNKDTLILIERRFSFGIFITSPFNMCVSLRAWDSNDLENRVLELGEVANCCKKRRKLLVCLAAAAVKRLKVKSITNSMRGER